MKSIKELIQFGDKMTIEKFSNFYTPKEKVDVRATTETVVENVTTFNDSMQKTATIIGLFESLSADLNLVHKDELESVSKLIIDHVSTNIDNLKIQLKDLSKNDLNLVNENIKILAGKVAGLNEHSNTNFQKYSKLLYDTSLTLEKKIKEVPDMTDKVVSIEKRLNVVEDKKLNEQKKATSLLKEDILSLESHISFFNNKIQEQNNKYTQLEQSTKQAIAEAKRLLVDDKYVEINKKINFIEQVLVKFNEKTVLTEGILDAPPETKTSDPLTPLNQNFVTFEQLQKHYSLFINRIQQQLTTIGGGGAVLLYDLDDINYNSVKNANNGDVLTYNSANLKWEAAVSGGGGGSLQVAGILKIDDGVHEQFQTKADATGTVTHDCALGHIFYHTSPDANWTANFTNLNLDSTYATALTLIIVQGAVGYYPNAVQIGGAAQTINWQGNVNPTVSTSRTDVVTFSIVNNSGTYTVLGQLTGF